MQPGSVKYIECEVGMMVSVPPDMGGTVISYSITVEHMDISRAADYFITCYTVLTRPNKVETAVHGCNSWLSVWTLSCRLEEVPR